VAKFWTEFGRGTVVSRKIVYINQYIKFSGMVNCPKIKITQQNQLVEWCFGKKRGGLNFSISAFYQVGREAPKGISISGSYC